DDLDALMALARLHSDLATFEEWLRARLQSPPASEGVQLATVHAVKGQEWPHVIVHDATEGVMPHRLAFDVEEERRVFHVAITRGIRTVALSCGQAPSPFVAELFSEPEATPQTPRAEPSPKPSRAEAQTTVRLGQRLSAGGYEGPVEELTGEGARIRVAGALLLIPWGATVVIGGKRSRLTRPPPAPDVAERARDLLREWRRTRA